MDKQSFKNTEKELCLNCKYFGYLNGTPSTGLQEKQCQRWQVTHDGKDHCEEFNKEVWKKIISNPNNFVRSKDG